MTGSPLLLRNLLRVVILLFTLQGCTGGITAPPAQPDGGGLPPGCNPLTCTGCCQAGLCLEGADDDSCGLGGGACDNCLAAGQTCSPVLGYCDGPSCLSNCQGKCPGDEDGCGGLCEMSDCIGCCQGTLCLDGATGEACGKDGADCTDCSLGGGACEQGTCTNCTPNCKDKCAGASNGCGGTCETSSCPGCCEGSKCVDGTASDSCGKGGAACVDCSSQGSACQSGNCSGCTPDCSGKCKGASDGCGGTCSTNACANCCSGSAACLSGTSNSACGKNGESCWVCPSDYQGYSWKCASQTCVKDQPTTTGCDGKTGGTVSCTKDGKSGKCWNNACCTGCYDVASSLCRITTNLSNTTCGAGGAACVNCTTTSKVCSTTGTCVSGSTNPCDGKTGGTTACTKDGTSGKCWVNACCTGCYDATAGYCRFATNLYDTSCGVGGVACVNCTATSKTCSTTGSCVAPPPCGGPCAAHEYCNTSTNTCAVKTTAKWRVTLVNASLDCVSKDWDTVCVGTDCKKPDVVVDIVWTADPSVCSNPLGNKNWTSSAKNNVCEPVWNQSVSEYIGGTPENPIIKSAYTADELKKTWCMQILDVDFGYTAIGTCLVYVTDGNFKAGYKTITYCPHPTESKDYLNSLKFTFTYVP